MRVGFGDRTTLYGAAYVGRRALRRAIDFLRFPGGPFGMAPAIAGIPWNVAPPEVALQVDSMQMAASGGGRASDNPMPHWIRLLSQLRMTAQGEYAPHLFIPEPVAPAGMTLAVGTEEIKHDLGRFMFVVVNMIIEKARIATTGMQTPLLKPASFPQTHLLARLRSALPELDQLRGVSTNGETLFVSFRNHFNFDEVDNIIMDNPAGIEFSKREARPRGRRRVNYYYNGFRIFSITSRVVHFPYGEIAAAVPLQVGFSLEALAELVSRIHNVRPYLQGGTVHYHRYVPILRELLGDAFRTGVLSRAVAHVYAAGISGKPGESPGLVETKKSKVKGPPEFRLKPKLCPQHVRYILLVPARKEIVIGIDSPLAFEEIKKRLSNGSFLPDAVASQGGLRIEEGKRTIQTIRAKFGPRGWQGTVKEGKVKEHVLTGPSGVALLRLSRSGIVIDMTTMPEHGKLILDALDSIFDGMLFYTNVVPNDRKGSSLSPDERRLITAIDNLVRFYNIFARPRVQREAFATSRPDPRLDDMDWVLVEMQQADTDNPSEKILYVLRRIEEIGRPDVSLFTRDNVPVRAEHEKMLCLIAAFERLVS